MKVLATLDGSPTAETIIPQLEKMARLPFDEIVLFSAVEHTGGGVRMRGPLRSVIAVSSLQGSNSVVVDRGTPGYVETKGQAVERELAEREDYLKHVSAGLPPGPSYRTAAVVAEDAATAIVQYALKEQPDVIVMATHGRTGLVHILFGDTAEEVVRSGVAPVLLVHPDNVRDARKTAAASAR